MQVVILHESLTGNTEQAARLIANAFFDHDVAARVFPVVAYDHDALEQADLVVAGTWTDGFILFGQRPGRKKRFKALPDLSGKRCAVFCTFAVESGHTLDKLSQAMADRGADVVGGLAIRRDRLAEGATDFVERVLAAVEV